MTRKRVAFLVFFISFTLVYSSIAFYLFSTPPAQAFMGFGVFTDKGLLGYTQGSGASVMTNQTFNWHFEVTNRIGSIQFVRIVFRLENNLTTDIPNETSPASTGSIGDVSTLIPNGESSSINFTWKILRTSQMGNLTFLTLDVNGHQASPPVGALSGANYRFIFELWTLDKQSGLFRYGWQGLNARIGSWLQVWFSLTS